MEKRLPQCFFRFIFMSLTAFFTMQIADASTEFKLSYDGHSVIGHNFDWTNPYAFIFIRPAGGINGSGGNLRWVSKYGSATVSASMGGSSRIIPLPLDVISGLNQVGLSASILWLESSPSDSFIFTEPVSEASRWIQYFLDNAKTVHEAIQLAHHIEKIEPATTFQEQEMSVHFMLHDATGDSAVMECLNGKLKIYHEKDLSVPVLTNTPYLESVQLLKKYQGFGGNAQLPEGYSTTARFVLAANFLKNLPTAYSPQEAVAHAFNGLGYLIEIPGSSNPTIGSVVYDLSNRVLYYRTIDNPQIRFIHLDHFNLEKGQPMKMMPMNNSLSGNVENYFSVSKWHGQAWMKKSDGGVSEIEGSGW